MGGAGSGTWYRWNRKASAEEHQAIDIRLWHRRGLLVPGRAFSWQWSCGTEPRESISVYVQPGAVVLDYRYCEHDEADWQPVRQPVYLTYTSCRFGGSRPWFACPCCGRRVALLYQCGGHFRCRHCSRLRYASQSEPQLDRIARRAHKIRQRLGASMDLTEGIWEKPKGMHWRTFERLRAQEERLSAVIQQALVRWSAVLRKKVP